MSEKPKKKSLWDLLNTPVTDLLKDKQTTTQSARAEQEAEEKAKREAEEKAKREAEELAKREAEELAKREAEELAKREAEEKAKREAEEKAKREAEEKAKQEAEEKAKREAEEKAKREAEEKAKQEAEELAKREAEEKAKREAEEKAKREAEEKAKREAEEKAKREAEEKAKREAEEKAKREAEEKAKREAEEKAKREAEEKAKREAEEKAKQEAEEKAKREAEEKAKQEAEELAKREAEELAQQETEAQATDSEKKAKKRTLWEFLNTPVQDLFKEESLDELEEEVSPEEADELAVLGLGRDKPQLEGKEKASWLSHFRERLSRTRKQFSESITRLAKGRTKVDEDMLEELEEILLQSDVGLDTTDDILEYLRAEAKKRRFLPQEVLPALSGYLEQTLESEPFRLEEGKLNIFLVVGVNGTGKTTTVGKVAAKLKIAGYKVMLAAGDTFRAAAIEQLGVWGKRVNCPVIQHHEGADAAAVIYDAIQSARAKKVDALLIDTAGRLHNKDYLMEELKKVHRIVEREKGDDRVENILVLDATTGQNGLRQAEVFSKSVPLNSLILTKLDGTAKGGVIFSIKRELGIPIKLLGVGESLGDLQEFDPKAFVQALFAQDEAQAEMEAEAAEIA